MLPGGGPGVDMAEIQRQSEMRQALVTRTIHETGSRIYANLISAYYINMEIGQPIDIERARQLANVAKELALFYPEALGMVNIQTNKPNEQPTE